MRRSRQARGKRERNRKRLVARGGDPGYPKPAKFYRVKPGDLYLSGKRAGEPSVFFRDDCATPIDFGNPKPRGAPLP